MTQRLENILNSKHLFIKSPSQREIADCVNLLRSSCYCLFSFVLFKLSDVTPGVNSSRSNTSAPVSHLQSYTALSSRSLYKARLHVHQIDTHSCTFYVQRRILKVINSNDLQLHLPSYSVFNRTLTCDKIVKSRLSY